MSLLREIQDAAVDTRIELPVVLRKCKILAARLHYDALNKWIDQELNGYDSKDGCPPYRILSVDSKGHFAGPFGSGLRDAPIPVGCLPEKYRDFVSTAYLTEGVSAYENLVKRSSSADSFQIPWPSDLVALASRRIYKRMSCLSAWQDISIGSVVNLLDTVRNRILSLVLEIEADAPDAGEAELDSRPISQERLTQVFNTYILGGTSSVAVGGSEFSQTIHQQVHSGDFSSLKDYLRTVGLKDEDFTELEVALKDDQKPEDPDHLGEKVSHWIGRMVGKTLTGAWNVGSSVAADLLVRAIRSYYGP